jgi:hypothetical protein
VPGIQKAHFRFRYVALERFRARRDEERIVLAPDREEARLVLAEIRLERGIQRHIAAVIEQQIQLDIACARPCQIVVVQRVAIG